ncbi:MAG TPA: hypothetical protein VNM45_21970 [Bacillus sp. (in: firmicutes)]|nr:hypothetical protein [Bacillus sp. (in: firmicutes)]
MANKNELQYGNWHIGGTDFNLNGIVSLNYETTEIELDLYSDEHLSLPYYTDVVYGKTYEGKAFRINVLGAFFLLMITIWSHPIGYASK